MIAILPTYVRLPCALIIALLLGNANAAAGDIGFVVGYRSVDTDSLSATHDTHPEDTFLPGAGVPGSAGTTSIRQSEWLFAGARLRKIVHHSHFSVDLLGLVAPDENSVRKQNENDFRSTNEGSFIYSTAELGVAGTLRYAYAFRRILAGIEAQSTAIYVESGWERFGRRQEEEKEFKFLSSVGPMVGFLLRPNTSLEASYQFGDTTGFSLLFAASF